MKKLMITIFALAAILLSLDKLYNFSLKENKNIKIANAVKGGLNYDILFQGPCEPLFTINPSIIDSITGLKSYNYSLRHTDFADNFLHLYLYLKNNTAPKQIYLYTTPESFDERFNTFHTYRFAPYLNDSIVNRVIKECDPNYHKYSKLPFFKFAYYNGNQSFDAIQGLKHYLSNKSQPYFKEGFLPHPNNEYANKKDGYIAPEHLVYAGSNKVSLDNDSAIYYELYEERQRFTWQTNREKHLNWIIKLCKQYQVKLILYESTPYINSVSDQPNRSTFIHKIDSIAKSNNIKFVTMDKLKLGNDKSNFVCPLILSVKGTKEFLPIFADTIIANYN